MTRFLVDRKKKKMKRRKEEEEGPMRKKREKEDQGRWSLTLSLVWKKELVWEGLVEGDPQGPSQTSFCVDPVGTSASRGSKSRGTP